MMTQACMDDLHDAIVAWSVTGNIEIRTHFASFIHWRADCTKGLQIDSHVCIAITVRGYCPFHQHFWHRAPSAVWWPSLSSLSRQALLEVPAVQRKTSEDDVCNRMSCYWVRCMYLSKSILYARVFSLVWIASRVAKTAVERVSPTPLWVRSAIFDRWFSTAGLLPVESDSRT